jgi:VanZ family protein
VRALREGERYAVFGLAAAAVFLGSVVAPPTGGPVASAAVPRPLGVPLDKWIHAGGYAVLAGLLCYATSARTTRAAVLAALVVSGYGFGIELVQGTLPARTFDLADAAANAAGSGLAALAWRVGRALGSR